MSARASHLDGGSFELRKFRCRFCRGTFEQWIGFRGLVEEPVEGACVRCCGRDACARRCSCGGAE